MVSRKCNEQPNMLSNEHTTKEQVWMEIRRVEDAALNPGMKQDNSDELRLHSNKIFKSRIYKQILHCLATDMR